MAENSQNRSRKLVCMATQEGFLYFGLICVRLRLTDNCPSQKIYLSYNVCEVVLYTSLTFHYKGSAILAYITLMHFCTSTSSY